METSMIHSHWTYFLKVISMEISGTPYFHALFHLLSSLAAYNVFIMFSLIDICRRSDEHQYTYRIKHFPVKGPISLPYIALNPDFKYLWSLLLILPYTYILHGA